MSIIHDYAEIAKRARLSEGQNEVKQAAVVPKLGYNTATSRNSIGDYTVAFTNTGNMVDMAAMAPVGDDGVLWISSTGQMWRLAGYELELVDMRDHDH